MRTIKTEEDLQALQRTRALSQPLLDYLTQEFSQTERGPWRPRRGRPLNLYIHVYLVLLEPGDNVRDPWEVGLNRVDRRLLGSTPEYVERVQLEDGTELYRIGILYDNEYMMLF